MEIAEGPNPLQEIYGDPASPVTKDNFVGRTSVRLGGLSIRLGGLKSTLPRKHGVIGQMVSRHSGRHPSAAFASTTLRENAVTSGRGCWGLGGGLRHENRIDDETLPLPGRQGTTFSSVCIAAG